MEFPTESLTHNVFVDPKCLHNGIPLFLLWLNYNYNLSFSFKWDSWLTFVVTRCLAYSASHSTEWDWIHKYIPLLTSKSESHSVMSDSLRPHELCSPWNSPGLNTGKGSLSLLQGIFPTHRSNPGLLHCRQILHQLSHKGSPRILVWVACPFSSRSSQPRNRTKVSCITGRFFTSWATREVPNNLQARTFSGIIQNVPIHHLNPLSYLGLQVILLAV